MLAINQVIHGFVCVYFDLFGAGKLFGGKATSDFMSREKNHSVVVNARIDNK